MTTATLLRKATENDKGVVVLPIIEYRQLLAATIHSYYLSGKEATDLDRLVEGNLREHRAGKSISANSIREAISIYRKQK